MRSAQAPRRSIANWRAGGDDCGVGRVTCLDGAVITASEQLEWKFVAGNTDRFAWLPGVSTLLSLAACYGTLAAIGGLAALGTTVALNDRIWAGAITAFAAIAAIGLVLSFRRHRRLWPLVLGGLGFASIAYAMHVDYSRAAELAGFALLAAAALGDWKLRRPVARSAPE